MYKKSVCANCTHFRPLRFNFGTECCAVLLKETSEQPPNIIPDFKNNGVKPFVSSDRTNTAAGVCLKSIEIITDAYGNKECCEINISKSQSHFEMYLNSWNKRYSNISAFAGRIERAVDVTQYMLVKNEDKYCGNCKRWREKEYDNKDLLAAYVPYDIEASKALLCPGIKGYCLHDISEKNSECPGCERHRGIFSRYKDAATTEDFIPVVSPRYRYKNAIRLVRSLLWLELFYRCKVSEEIVAVINDSKQDSLKRELSKREKKISGIVNPRKNEVLYTSFVEKITGCDRDTINRHLFDDVISSEYSYYLMGRLSDYFDIPLEFIYGIRHEEITLDASQHEELMVKLVGEPLNGNKYRMYETPSYLWVDELFLYGMSILLKVYSESELKRFIRDYKEYADSMRNRISKTEHDTRSIKSRVIDSNSRNTIRNLSLATGIKEKQIKNYYAIRNKNGEYVEGKGKLNHMYLLRICKALGVPMNEVISGERAKVLNPFEHYSDEQIRYNEYTKDLYYHDYLLNNIRYLYSLNSEGTRQQQCGCFDNDLMKTIIDLYRTCGIDGSITMLTAELPKLRKNHPDVYNTYLDEEAFKMNDYSY